MSKIIVKLHGSVIQELKIKKDSISIGRDAKCDIILDDILVSRHHAKIVLHEDAYHIQDLKSGNGILVNGKKVTKKALRTMDEISIGNYSLTFINQDQSIFESSEDSDEAMGEKTFVLPINRPEVMAVLARQQAPATEVNHAPLEGHIIMISGQEPERSIALTNVSTVAGKSPTADIKLTGLFVGQNAFTISKKPEGFFITHFEGRRMTKVNGSVVIGQRELQDGDLITIGPTMMRFSRKSEA